MKRFSRVIMFSVSSIVLIACGSCSKNKKEEGSGGDTLKTVTYRESTADFANPERGFYRYSETRAGNYTPLSQSQLEGWRTLKQADGGNYQVYSTLVFRYFVLDIFKTSALSPEYLQKVADDFAIARNAGVKLIPRFVYTTSVTAGSCPEGFICPPYGDASKTTVLEHIAQLKPLLTANADVIAVVQLGLIGTWGENYYTDYFGDASQNGQGKLLDNNWSDRNEIIAAMLDALPADRMLQVRYPQIKQRFVYGINANVTVPGLQPLEAYNGQPKSRIGYHNDCFLASPDDYGTYSDYGNSSTPRQSATTTLRNYWKEDSRFVAVGGETCDDAYSPQNDCEPAGIAETEMREMHYSYLNCAYNNSVNNDWQTAGCMENIRRKLGYRFVLKKATHPPAISAGDNGSFKFEFSNEGYAAPFNPRTAYLVLHKAGSPSHSIPLITDVRYLQPGAHTYETTLTIPASVAKGTYQLYLWMPDKSAALAPRSAYAIRLANDNMWDEATGMNNLASTIEIQ